MHPRYTELRELLTEQIERATEIKDEVDTYHSGVGEDDPEWLRATIIKKQKLQRNINNTKTKIGSFLEGFNAAKDARKAEISEINTKADTRVKQQAEAAAKRLVAQKLVALRANAEASASYGFVRNNHPESLGELQMYVDAARARVDFAPPPNDPNGEST